MVNAYRQGQTSDSTQNEPREIQYVAPIEAESHQDDVLDQLRSQASNDDANSIIPLPHRVNPYGGHQTAPITTGQTQQK